jgi:hypothetical protein
MATYRDAYPWGPAAGSTSPGVICSAYPIAVGPTVPARFVGRVDGATIVVTVTVDDTVQHATVVRGPATVTYAHEPRLMQCPICRRPIIRVAIGRDT